MVNPFPLARRHASGRAHATTIRWSPSATSEQGATGPGCPAGAARSRREVQRAVRPASLAPRPGPGRVLGVDRRTGVGVARGAAGDADPGQQLITVVRKGRGRCSSSRRSPDAFVWLRLYQASWTRLVATGPDDPIWWTLRRPWRRLTYHAACPMFVRANAALGANWSLHDLRHTAAYRMARDPDLPLTDVQWVLGHVHLSTTQLYLTPRARGRDLRGPGPPLPAGRGCHAAGFRRRRRATGRRRWSMLFGQAVA